MPIGRDRAVLTQIRTLFNVGTIRDLTDGQLLERFATVRGEPAELAFAVLVERHGPMVWRVCRGVLPDPHDAQDAFQATFLVLVKKARALWVRDSLGPWLFQVAHRTASCARAAEARRRRHERDAVAANEPRHGSGEPTDDELARVLHEEINRLPERYRAPVVLCDLEGRTHEQAARHLGWPVGTVKSRQARARTRLRNRLVHRGFAPSAALLAIGVPSASASAGIPAPLVDATASAAVRFGMAATIAHGSAASLAQGVLNSMSMTRWFQVASALLVSAATATGAGLFAGKRTPGPTPQREQNAKASPAADEVSFTVKPGKLIVGAMGTGALEATHTYDEFCRVKGGTAIMSLVPEGTIVTKGEVVGELDSAALSDRLVNQVVAIERAEVDYHNAVRAREVAEIALREYTAGIHPWERKTLEGQVVAARSAGERAGARLERARRARKRLLESIAANKGARTPADIVAELEIEDRIAAAEAAIEQEKLVLEQTKAKQELLENYTGPKTTKALEIEVDRLRTAELEKKATWQLAITEARKLERQIASCTLKAPANGVLVYANDPARGGGRVMIEEGASVRERQKIFYVADLSQMQVSAKVPESRIKSINRNLKAKIRVPAFPDRNINGTVLEVAALPDVRTMPDGVKTYTVKVGIANNLPGLRPGMVAEVELLGGEELDNVLSVPVQAVLHYYRQNLVMVKELDGRYNLREVILGRSNEKFIEVKQGIASGESIALNPVAFLSDEQKRAMFGAPTQPATKPGVP
jgi:RND family efflux transporter MFP subunit